MILKLWAWDFANKRLELHIDNVIYEFLKKNGSKKELLAGYQ